MTGLEDWWAVHVFLFDPQQSEACLLDDIVPTIRDLLAQGKAAGWFFIRYWEGGPHLRVRVAGVARDDREAFLQQLRTRLVARRSDLPVTRETYYGQHSFDGEPVSVAELPWYGDAQAVEIAYEPETVRYGGPAALPESERLFQVSSEIAASLVAATRSDPGKRMGAAFMLMLATASVAGGSAEGIIAFCENYASMWQGYSAQTGEAAGAPLAAPSPAHLAAVHGVVAGDASGGSFAQHWRRAVAAFHARLERIGDEGALVSPLDGAPATTPEAVTYAIIGILWSQLHMINNRIAILPAQEVLVARTVAAAARQYLVAREVAA